MGKEAAPTKSF